MQFATFLQATHTQVYKMADSVFVVIQDIPDMVKQDVTTNVLEILTSSVVDFGITLFMK